MYRLEWRKPGCVLLLIFGALALIPAAFVVSIIDRVVPGDLTGAPEICVWLIVLTGIVVALSNAYGRLTRRRVPICPHCGAVTDPRFRICRSCRRVKR